MESHLRSVVKSLTYRIFIGFGATTLIAWLATGQVALGAGIGLADTIAKAFLYYAYERIWNRVQFGLVRPSLDGREGDGI